jgi:hypothetical protein
MKLMKLWQRILRPPWRTIIPGCGFLLAVWLAYWLWSPGLDVRDGRHDRRKNGIWLSHGWLGADKWFIENGKSNELQNFRNPDSIRLLAEKLRRNHITDVFPHLCPAEPNGSLPMVGAAQVERFLDAFDGFRVMPWVGGPNGVNVRLGVPKWRAAFAANVQELVTAHPRLAGVQINVEPLPNGDTNFLTLLEELRRALPPGKLLSVAAYPPATRWHPYTDVHWDEAYFREVAKRSDQMAVMMYDVGQHMPKFYQHLMVNWTQETLAWSEGKPVLLGVPTYNNAGVDYHDPKVENLTNALLGIHRGLSRTEPSANYQGVAIYCDWETSPADWSYFQDHFLERETLIK